MKEIDDTPVPESESEPTVEEVLAGLHEELRKCKVRYDGLRREITLYHDRNLHARVRRIEMRLKDSE